MGKKKITILPMDFNKDKAEIAEWETRYAGSPEFESIQSFILDDTVDGGLTSVIENNCEYYPIGDDEKKLAFVAKTDECEIVGWVLVYIFDLKTKNPQMYVQYFVVNPKYQNQGYGTQIAKELFLNSKKYIGFTPSCICSHIDVRNSASMLLFSKFNFSFVPLKNCQFFQAQTTNAKMLGSSFENIVFDDPFDLNGSSFGE